MKRAMLSLLLTATIGLATQGCPAEGGKAKEATSVGDGRTQFSASGKLRFNRQYSAHGGSESGCRWRVETEPNGGLKKGQKPTVQGSGGYGRAKIKVAKPKTVKVFLVSSRCGSWK